MGEILKPSVKDLEEQNEALAALTELRDLLVEANKQANPKARLGGNELANENDVD